MDKLFANFCFKSGWRIGGTVLTVLALTAALSLIVPAFPVIAAANPELPKGGAVLDGAKAPEQPAASPAPDLEVPEPTPAAADTAKRIRVNAFRFSGELPVAEIELQKIAAAQVGKDLSLDDMNQLAGQITHYLREQGFSVATAYIPAQQINDGLVEIAVIPGKYGAIVINNQAQIADRRLAKLAAGLKEGDIVTKRELERVLLLINDLPGIDIKAGLTPGKEAGTTDLTLNVIDAAQYSGSVYADNSGNRYTGAVRGGFGASVANPGHYGDALQIGGQTAGSGLKSFNLDYNLPLGYRGMRLTLDYSRVDYELGKDFADLDASGDTNVAGLTVSYPFKRSRGSNLYGTFGYDYKDLYDEIATADDYEPKTDRLIKLGVNGNFTDRRRGVNQYAVTWSHGNLSIDNADAAASDAASGKTAGGFNKLLLNYRRRRQLSLKYSLECRLSGQLSDGNLDSSEKFYLGGADGVRAYPQGEAASDQGCLLTVELKRAMPQWSNAKNQIYLVGFSDYAYGQINKNLWEDATDDNYRNLADLGLGFGWARQKFNLRLDYAVKLGGEDAESDTDKSGRIWLQCVRYF